MNKQLARWQWGIVALLTIYLCGMAILSQSGVDLLAQLMVAPIFSYLVVALPGLAYRAVKGAVGRVVG